MEGLDYALMMEMEASDAAMQDQDLLDQQEIDFLLEAAASMASAVENAMSGSERRRVVSRGLPMESCLAHYLLEGDAATFKFQFRMTKRQLHFASDLLADRGFLKTNECRNQKYRITGHFKFAVCMFVVAHGGNGTCPWKPAADAACLGTSTVKAYMFEFVQGCFTVLAPRYMPATPPTPDYVEKIRSTFASRRGVPNVALAVDGTHIPFAPIKGDKDVYRNYKGWHSILLVAYVNSMHLIVNPFVAGTGRTSDNGALKWCAFLQKLQNPEERVKWLGQDGLVAGDGGTSDNKGILLTPIPGATELEDLWYNFCHSSTRFFVEETFGRLKNRFRMLLTEMHMPYPLAARIIAACCVLHN